MNPRKKQILDVAHRLFIEKGFQSTSIQDILDGAQIAKGTFYNHFASKNACLMAILDQVKEEASFLRQQLSLGKPKNDPEIFIQQVLIRLKMNREQSLIALYESVFFSKDQELKSYMRLQHINELNWTAQRIVELFGEDAKRYSIDYAVIFFGIIQQSMHIRMLRLKKEHDLEETVRFALKQLQVLSDHQNEKVPFFPSNWLDEIEKNKIFYSKDDLKEKIINQLNITVSHFKTENKAKGKINYLDFLLTEIQSESPRAFLIESVLHSVRNIFIESVYEEDINKVCDLVKEFLEFDDRY
ncbi:TetR/AcrR family transcriptional regulator [Bacillus sp. IITD106]|nr:TetR/AcrR family transcriptional regulator [Bacillus sp. IITD106]